jgi:hypothetical protein
LKAAFWYGGNAQDGEIAVDLGTTLDVVHSIGDGVTVGDAGTLTVVALERNDGEAYRIGSLSFPFLLEAISLTGDDGVVKELGL